MGLLQICQTIEGVKDYSDDPWGWVDHGWGIATHLQRLKYVAFRSSAGRLFLRFRGSLCAS